MKIQKRRTFLHDAVDMVAMSMHAVEKDDFTRCFKPLPKKDMSRSGLLYVFSVIIRYTILLPVRLILLILSLLIYLCMIAKALYYNSSNKRANAYKFIIKALNFILTARVVNHGTKQRLHTPHIYVANHTSFVDFLLLSNHAFPHACVSENHGGLFAMLFTLILGKNGSITFKRCEKLDRSLVKEKLKAYVNSSKQPMIVFPEGTCVNNKHIVMFQKGVFELDVDICPVAIKYRKHVMDPYWNRRKHGFALHLLYLMTRWYVQADIYWMPPMRKEETEKCTQFVERVRSEISQKADLKLSLWNGYLKSSPAIKDRDLLKVAYIRSYCHVKCASVVVEPALLDTSSSTNIFLFNKVNYKEMLVTVLKEYHALKCLHSSQQDYLISLLATKTPMRLTKKLKCSCNIYRRKNRRRNIYLQTTNKSFK